MQTVMNLPSPIQGDFRAIVFGSGGMLGREAVACLKQAGFEVDAPRRPAVDILRPESIRAVLEQPDGRKGLVINCAAYTAVDRAESEPEAAFAVNRDGPANLARECLRLGLPLVHISTDYVFDGNSVTPYREEDAASPINVYGRSKWEGEEAVRLNLADHIIVRTSWLYGAQGANFVKTMLRLGREREVLTVVSDQHGCPTWTGDLAECIARIAVEIASQPGNVDWGTYHFCGKGITTWYDFARTIIEQGRKWEFLKVTEVKPVPTSSYPTPAARPQWSVMDCRKIGEKFGIFPPPWETSLTRMLQELRQAETPLPGN
ncbi:MAG: dTDP-4-dehydrorhamnose reductase [Syntrophobacter sp.]